MPKFESKTHRCDQLMNGEFYIYRLAEMMLSKTTYTAEGTTTEVIPISDIPSLRPMQYVPFFVGNYAGDGRYNIDMDCGAQRWNGTKTGKAVGLALRVCKFDAQQIGDILHAARKGKAQTGVARRY